MPKFFVDKSNIYDQEIIIQDNNVNHIKNVLRLGLEDEILINDRQGNDYKCIIKAISNQCITAHIKAKMPSQTEPHTQVILFQPLIKGEKMEWVLQKVVEIGVTKIITLSTDRCIVKIDTPKKMQSKVERWNKIAEAAAKQSGRGVVPQVEQPMTFKEAVSYIKENNLTAIIPYENEKETGIKSVIQSNPNQVYGILIGPEGGFTEEEIEYAVAHGIQPVTLGQRILRSETASIVTLTNIMYEMGEMG